VPIIRVLGNLVARITAFIAVAVIDSADCFSDDLFDLLLRDLLARTGDEKLIADRVEQLFDRIILGQSEGGQEDFSRLTRAVLEIIRQTDVYHRGGDLVTGHLWSPLLVQVKIATIEPTGWVACKLCLS